MIKNYVINICTDSLRQQHIIEQFTKQAVDFEFFSAITSKNYVEVAKNLNIDIKKSVSSPNEIACFLSHASLWQKCVDENLGYVGIYEDDIFLGKNFNRIISQENFLQTNGIELLKLEKVSPRLHLTNPIEMPDTGRTVYQLSSSRWCRLSVI